MLEFSLIIPLYNEANNIAPLIDEIALTSLVQDGLQKVILVNNGSQDDTGPIIDQLAKKYPWVKAVQQKENLNYGGGVYEGCQHAATPFVGYIPGDRQVSPGDVVRVWQHLKSNHATYGDKIFVKGRRTVRHDGMNTRFVSVVYTILANLILNLRVTDLNGLPKIFHRSLLAHLPAERMRTFVFDAQLLTTARQHHWTILEIPVTFHARRAGVSSWSSKRLSTYKTTFMQILRLRKLRKLPS